MSSELIELGLTKECPHFTVEQEPTGETYKIYCKRPVREFGGFCSRHSAEAELVKQAKIAKQATVLVEKAKMEEEILPKASQRVMDILDNDEAKDADVIKIWQTTMDRVGLAATQSLEVTGEVKVTTSLEILRGMLTPPTAAEELDIVDAEVVPELE